jgi:hypothetical protein
MGTGQRALGRSQHMEGELEEGLCWVGSKGQPCQPKTQTDLAAVSAWHLCAVCPWASYLIFLCSVIIISNFQGWYGDN